MDSVAFDALQTFRFGGRAMARLPRSRPARTINCVMRHPEIPQQSFTSKSVTQPQSIIRYLEAFQGARDAQLRELEDAAWAEIDDISPSYDDLIRYASEIRPPLDYYAE